MVSLGESLDLRLAGDGERSSVQGDSQGYWYGASLLERGKSAHMRVQGLFPKEEDTAKQHNWELW